MPRSYWLYTATIPASANIGDEKSGGRKLAQALTNGIDPIKVGMLATDADGRMAEGFSTVMKESGDDYRTLLGHRPFKPIDYTCHQQLKDKNKPGNKNKDHLLATESSQKQVG